MRTNRAFFKMVAVSFTSSALMLFTNINVGSEIQQVGWNTQTSHCNSSACGDCPSGSQYIGPADITMPDGTEVDPNTERAFDDLPRIDLDNAQASTLGASAGPRGVPHMIGDMLSTGPFASSQNAPFASGFGGFYSLGGTQGQYPVVSPFGVRTFKIAENQSVDVVNRHYIQFSHFNDLGGRDTQLSRINVGFEHMISSDASIGLRLPMYLVDPFVQDGIGQFGTGTNGQADLGDLTAIFKYVVSRNPCSGNVISTGLAITAPTGPDTLADVDPVLIPNISHNGTIQPYVGLLAYLPQNWFVHYFSSLDVPFDSNDSTFWLHDIGVGSIIRTGKCRGLTAIIPTVEFHANIPLNNRVITVDQFNLTNIPDANGIPGELIALDQVNVTNGVTFEFNNRSTLALGLVSTIGNEDIYNWEFQLMFNVFGDGYMNRYSR